MIKVNLARTVTKKAAAAPKRQSLGPLPIILILIIAATLAGGYYWYSSLSSQAAGLSEQIAAADKQLKDLDAIIKQNQVFEARKTALETRITIINDLRRSQVSPVVSLDVLADAIDRTEFVWLESLDQNNATFSMNGTGTSVDAIADFVSNLEATRYFRNINLQRAEDARGNFTFSMTCEFSPPAPPEGTLEKGAN